ncbi:MAG: urea transporter [Pseudomonadota bacterium]
MNFKPSAISLQKIKTGLGCSVKTALAGIGQIYFQPTPLSGAAILLALCLTRAELAAACLLGVGIASLLAWACGFSRSLLTSGLYGYNAALTSAGLCALYQPNLALLGWICAASIATTMLSHAFLRWQRLPALTLPFVLAMLLAHAVGPVGGLLAQAKASNAGLQGPLSFLLLALAQVSFIGHAALGVPVLAALALHCRQQALSATAGGLLAWCCLAAGAAMWPDSIITLNTGAIGLNCILAAQGLAAAGRAWRWRIGGALASLLLCCCATQLGLAYFTLPFILASWGMLVCSAPRMSPSSPQPVSERSESAAEVA